MTESIPSLSIKDYLIRLSQFTKINESTIILILIYIDRIGKINKFVLTYRNIYKLILASMVIAIKYNEDLYFTNEQYAKVGGVSVQASNDLELYSIQLLNFNLFISEDIYEKYIQYITNYSNK